MQLLQTTWKKALTMLILTLASLVASFIPSSLSASPTPISTAVAGIEIPPGGSISFPFPDSLRPGYYTCETTISSPSRSDIIAIGKHILKDGYSPPNVPPGKQCGELATSGSAVFYICGWYPTGGQDDGVVAGVTSILDHCEMDGRAEGVFRVSEHGVLVITSVIGGLVDHGELGIDF
ncbi:hypothetical protein B9Z19DRAFT_1105972 [Tuber borchii]|uniref:Uncharacterized protein n=1 Tax=Tuber borchii TaxID=42251 RepID=A0A2T7A388_TUBBO|nr:hypothetical protein B9Z19DRAFT_1105972 [Tuber borchii]